MYRAPDLSSFNYVACSDYVHRVGRTARAGRGGWALSLVTQHDVALVHAIEELIGHQLQQFNMEESEVLKSITRVRTCLCFCFCKVYFPSETSHSMAMQGSVFLLLFDASA